MKQEDIDSRIERVINNIASKKQQMQQWDDQRAQQDKRRKTVRRRWRIGISIAAMVVLAFGIGFTLIRPEGNFNAANPQTDDESPVFRGGTNYTEIERLINAGEADSALMEIQRELADTVIDPALPPEQKEYIRSLQQENAMQLEQLRRHAEELLNSKDQ